MTTREADPFPPSSREVLELRADRARARLSSTLTALERRKKDLTDLKLQARRLVVPVLKKNVVPLAIAAGALVLVTGALLAMSAYGGYKRRRHPLQTRARALLSVWNHPERATQKKSSPLLGFVAKRLGMGALNLIALAVGEYVRKAAEAAQARAEAGESNRQGATSPEELPGNS